MPRPITACALAAALAATAAPALAQSQRLQAAWDAATAEGPVLEDAAAARLNQIAYHSAVDGLCEGFEIDVAEISAAANAVLADAAALDPEAAMARQAEILVALGTAHGIFLAEGSLNPAAFCAEAAAVRDDPAFDDHWR
jgi:uncharacterized protein with LGFP repeats